MWKSRTGTGNPHYCVCRGNTYLYLASETVSYHTLSPKAFKLSRKRCQKSLKSGRSIFFRLSLVLASTLTYSCVTGSRVLRGGQRGRFITGLAVIPATFIYTLESASFQSTRHFNM